MAAQDETKPLKYRRIADDLRSGIARGDYTPGGALPGENDLMARYKVARMTVRQALAELQREGLAVARRGSGVYVSAGAHAVLPVPANLDPNCALAHGAPAEVAVRTLVAVFANETARHLLEMGAACGFRPQLVEPDPARAEQARAWAPGLVTSLATADLDETCDVVVTDHHREELAVMLRDALAGTTRWIGVMGNPRDPGPPRDQQRDQHWDQQRDQLSALGVPKRQIDRVRRPIGLNIGSRTPAEIAVATLAGLIADHNGRPGGFRF